MMLQRLTVASRGTAIEVFVQQDLRPHGEPERAFWEQARGWWSSHSPGEVGTATPPPVALPLDTTYRRLYLDFNDGGFFRARKGLHSFPTAWTALRRRAEVTAFDHHRQGGTVTAAVPRTAELLASLAGIGYG